MDAQDKNSPTLGVFGGEEGKRTGKREKRKINKQLIIKERRTMAGAGRTAKRGDAKVLSSSKKPSKKAAMRGERLSEKKAMVVFGSHKKNVTFKVNTIVIFQLG